MILIGALLCLAAAAADSTSPGQAVRRVAATAQLAAQEYRIGVVDGQVVAQAEVDEARLFLEEAKRTAGTLPGGAAPPAVAALDTLLQLVAGLAPPDTIASRVRVLSSGLAARFRITLDELPRQPPRLARGAELYQSSCSSCH
nr:hypothetical protein [Gemmatimonadales bacterium]